MYTERELKLVAKIEAAGGTAPEMPELPAHTTPAEAFARDREARRRESILNHVLALAKGRRTVDDLQQQYADNAALLTLLEKRGSTDPDATEDNDCLQVALNHVGAGVGDKVGVVH